MFLERAQDLYFTQILTYREFHGYSLFLIKFSNGELLKKRDINHTIHHSKRQNGEILKSLAINTENYYNNFEKSLLITFVLVGNGDTSKIRASYKQNF